MGKTKQTKLKVFLKPEANGANTKGRVSKNRKPRQKAVKKDGDTIPPKSPITTRSGKQHSRQVVSDEITVTDTGSTGSHALPSIVDTVQDDSINASHSTATGNDRDIPELEKSFDERIDNALSRQPRDSSTPNRETNPQSNQDNIVDLKAEVFMLNTALKYERANTQSLQNQITLLEDEIEGMKKTQQNLKKDNKKLLKITF